MCKIHCSNSRPCDLSSDECLNALNDGRMRLIDPAIAARRSPKPGIAATPVAPDRRARRRDTPHCCHRRMRLFRQVLNHVRAFVFFNSKDGTGSLAVVGGRLTIRQVPLTKLPLMTHWLGTSTLPRAFPDYDERSPVCVVCFPRVALINGASRGSARTAGPACGFLL